MTNTKQTKRALLTSVMALFLCFAMLLGTTYAWFTDSVTSANNIIKSGNLDIVLEYWNGTKWTDVKDQSDILDGELWEPGYADVAYLRFKNAGSLALKYQLGVNIVNEKEGTNVSGAKFKLSDYIYYDVVDPYAVTDENKPGFESHDAAVAAATKPAKISVDYAKQGTLTAKSNYVYLAMVVYMPETVGNVANHNGKDVPQIDLGINILATQMAYEKDGTGDTNYDKDAIHYDTLVTSAEELYAAVASASKNTVIAVDGNIVLTKALSKGGLESIKFVAFDDEATIDQATYNMHFSGAKVTFEGLTLTHGEKTYGNGGQSSTAFAVWDAVEVNYINCTFNRSVGALHASLHNFIGCTFNGVENPDNSKSEYPLYICDGQDYNVIDCVFYCTNRGAILFYNDGGSGVDTLNISNTQFFGDIIADKTAVEIHNNSNAQTYNVNIDNVVLGTGIINGLYRIKPGNVGHVNVKVDGIVNNVIAITNEDDLVALGGTKINGTYMLMADLDMAGYDMKPIMLNSSSVLTFNGNNHTISNLNLVQDYQNGMYVSGLFNILHAGISLNINDLTITNAVSESQKYASVVFAYNPQSNTPINLDNVDVDGAKVTGESVAALVGYTVGILNLTDCDVANLELTGAFNENKVGALVGTANQTSCAVTVTNCTNSTTYRDYGRVIYGATWNGGVPVTNTAELITAIKNAPVGSTTTILMADGTYAGNIDITVAALGQSGGDVVIKAMQGATPVIAGTVTLGYRDQGTGATMYNANVTFEGITFDHANAETHSIYVQDVKSLNLTNCTIIGDGEYGINCARGNATGTSKIVGCTFENAGMQLLGNFATGLEIDGCTFNNSCINVQAGNGVTVKGCIFNNTLTDANVGESFYLVRSNSTPITVENCIINIDSTVSGVATAQAKWGVFWNRGTTNWTVSNVTVTLTAAADAQDQLLITKCTSTGSINTTDLTVNGVKQ